MAVTLVNLTGDLADLIGTTPDTRRTRVWIETNIPEGAIVDATGNLIRLGNAKADVGTDGTFTFTGLVATNSTTNPTNFQYRVTVEYLPNLPAQTASGKHQRWTSGWFSLTATTDLADVVAAQYVPPTYMTTATNTLQGYVDEGKTYRDQQAAISGLTGEDSAVANLVKDSTTPSTTRAALSATFAPLAPSVGFLPLKAALDAGRTTAIHWTGDSTGDSDGSVAANDRYSTGFLRKIAAKYPAYHVMTKRWNDTTQGFDPWVTVQAQAAGRRYVSMGGRSLRWGQTINFASGNMDLRALIDPTTYTPAAVQVIVAQVTDEVAAYGTQFQYRWNLTTTGGLTLFWSTDGSSWGHTYTSSANIAGTPGTPLWVRATLEIVVGTSETVKFYTSTDGVTWTQLGTTQGFTGAVSAMKQAGAYPEVGGYGWSSVADAFAGKVYEVQVRDGVDGPMLTPASPLRWSRYPDSLTTYGGAPTLFFLNASRSGSAMSYHTDATRLKKETPDYGQILAVFNDSHNEVGLAGKTQWTDPYLSWAQSVQGRLPLAAVAVVGQNPHTSAWANEASYGQEHKTRVAELASLAARSGWSFVNIYQRFLNEDPTLANYVSSDGLHPTAAGYDAGARELLANLGFSGAS